LGHGLVGVRERVKIYGGDMSAGTSGDGGFVLRARLPLDGGGT
jgi:signal transduction histidine kinase